MSLRELMDNELPLNRKERFFTGTVLPMIVCRDNFKHFGPFLSLLECCEMKVSADSDSSNIQFFTEYSLVESIYRDQDKKRLLNPPTSKDTPDIMILVIGNPKTLIAVEAKMYDTPTSSSLSTQLINQRKHILFLKEKLSIKQIIQCALIPEELKKEIGKELSRNLENDSIDPDYHYRIITWQKILEKYQECYPKDYFVNILQIALDSYKELVTARNKWMENCEEKARGNVIYDDYKAGRRDKKIMGRIMGLRGDFLSEDIESGGWEHQEYETSSKEKPFNRNWFYIKAFVDRIDSRKREG